MWMRYIDCIPVRTRSVKSPDCYVLSALPQFIGKISQKIIEKNKKIDKMTNLLYNGNIKKSASITEVDISDVPFRIGKGSIGKKY